MMTMTAQARTFKPVGLNNGLAARVAVSMMVDQKGYLWVGSREGLFRYDGYQVEAFVPDPGTPGSISDIDIRFVYEATNGDIWIGTNTGGLNRYDPVSESFTHYRHDPADTGSVLDDSIYGIAQGPEGRLWVATQRGLSRLDTSTGRFEHFIHDDDDPGSLAHNWAFKLYLGPGGDLWIGTVGGGLNRWNPEQRNFSRFDLAAMTGGPANRNDVFALHEDALGQIWAGTREGLVRLSPDLTSAEYIAVGETSRYLPVITTMVADDGGRLFLGTMQHGVLVIDKLTGSWRPAHPGPLGSSGNLPDQPQMNLAIAGEQLFVGTWGSGVFRAPLDESAFLALGPAASGTALNNDMVSAILATGKPGEVWVGTFGGGPQLVEIETGAIRATSSNDSLLHTSGVLDLARDDQGRLFAATTFGLLQFDDEAGLVASWIHDPAEQEQLGDGYVSALLNDGDQGLWVGVMGSGLHYLHHDSGALTAYRHDPDRPDSISGDFITTLLEGMNDTLWVGTRSNGLNRCNKETMSCERFKRASGGLGNDHVTALYRDRRGRVWAGTDGGGLNLLNDGAVTGFQIWNQADGLLNDGIMAIEEDQDESLWLSTRHGLSRLNPATGAVVNFVAESGLPFSHYNTNASASDEQFIYFGSIDGLLGIRKGSLLQVRPPSQVRVTLMQTAARNQQPQTVRRQGAPIRIPFGEIITFQFATLDFSEKSHHYQYRLRPEDNWTPLGGQRQIIFHGLSPGSYRFQARGRDVYGLWGESDPVDFTVVPPFWMTTWFRLLLVLIMLLAGVALHLARAGRIQRSAREIQRLSETREYALEQALGSKADLAMLTPRQKEVLQLIAEGYATREIADLLNVSIKTVEAHRANLMERLDIHDVPGLVRLAIRARLVSAHE